MYNVTPLLNTTNYADYIILLNQESGYLLGIVFMATVSIIVVLALYREGMQTATAASGFVTTIIAIILFAMNILSPEWVIYTVILMAAGLISLWIKKD